LRAFTRPLRSLTKRRHFRVFLGPFKALTKRVRTLRRPREALKGLSEPYDKPLRALEGRTGPYKALKVLIRPYKALYLDKIPDIEGLTKSSEKA
jgi:hypothetical protein